MGVRVLLLAMLWLAGCNKHYHTTGYAYTRHTLLDTIPASSSMETIIKPYKDSLQHEMNVVLAYADDALTKTQPESDLGNLMCDLVLKKSRDYYGQPVHFTFLNHGGIRLPSLPKGEITLGKMIELMPFENRIAVMQVSGYTIDTLFNHMAAKGGWHVSGAAYVISNGTARQIQIAGSPLVLGRTYTMAVSDYLAQGGDNCTMLKGIPYFDTRKTLRDALVEGLQEMNSRGEHVKSILEGRIKKEE